MNYSSVVKCTKCDYIFLGNFQNCPNCGSTEILTSIDQNDIDSLNTEFSRNIWGQSLIIAIVIITIVIVLSLII